VEEYLNYREVSLLAFTDGKTVVPMVPACDYKRVFDKDKGPNTGGMGSYSPPGFFDSKLTNQVVNTILQPTVQAELIFGAILPKHYIEGTDFMADYNETGGLWLQKATHDLDYINYIMGEPPATVFAMESQRVFNRRKPAGLTCNVCEEWSQARGCSDLRRRGCRGCAWGFTLVKPSQVASTCPPHRRSGSPGCRARTGSQTLVTYQVGALPILNHVLARMKLEDFLREYIEEDPRCEVSPIKGVILLVLNFVCARQPIYGVGYVYGGELRIAGPQLAAADCRVVRRQLPGAEGPLLLYR
jgi:hypothetical protein